MMCLIMNTYSFIKNIGKAPLQVDYSEVLRTPAQMREEVALGSEGRPFQFEGPTTCSAS